MKFNADKVSLGRHETFALRYSWLSKGFQAIMNKDFDITDVDSATVKLGVGKNMVSSIRYWLRACQIVQNDGITLSDLGKLIFGKDGYDPYLEDEATIWLVHWLLATNAEQATSLFWFFNKFHRPEFTALELQTALSDFFKESIIKGKKPSANTINSDAALIARMYSPNKKSKRTPLEESLDSPLSLLRLITQSAGEKGFQSKPEARAGLPTGIFGYAVTAIMNEKNITSMPIEELLYSRDDYAAPGAVFRLTESGLVTKLELMVQYIDGVYEIRETAGIHQIYQLDKVLPESFLEKHYSEHTEEVAA